MCRRGVGAGRLPEPCDPSLPGLAWASVPWVWPVCGTRWPLLYHRRPVLSSLGLFHVTVEQMCWVACLEGATRLRPYGGTQGSPERGSEGQSWQSEDG